MLQLYQLKFQKTLPQYNNSVDIENVKRITLKTGMFYNSGV